MPSALHLFFIPTVLAMGIVIGFMIANRLLQVNSPDKSEKNTLQPSQEIPLNRERV